ncbi:hypothetical protein CBW65_14935 [Tumebacillus avium]|uniref:Uncharacterized protein n=1 Tax=Tumebacillus avium TaxID=1903704 RepID=A0A1Y0INM6_9BACL|nr:hypothetical protein [Tumebacillus avium]ARU62151.1 hypothetical protein CBW65_14935 [Tumebacillus avium]
MENLQDLLNCLWAGVIEKHTVDLFNHTIEFDVRTNWGGVISYHHLKFTGVKAVYYINDQFPSEPEEGDYLELSSVSYDKDMEMEVKVSADSKEYSHLNSKANFLLEIWGREVLIDALSVEVDGKFFEVGCA